MDMDREAREGPSIAQGENTPACGPHQAFLDPGCSKRNPPRCCILAIYSSSCGNVWMVGIYLKSFLVWFRGSRTPLMILDKDRGMNALSKDEAQLGLLLCRAFGTTLGGPQSPEVKRLNWAS